MKAAVRSKYGSPDVLSIKEIDKPSPKDTEVLIRVYAASANRSDYHILTGRPFIMRLFTGLFKPKLAATGCDFAGQVDATGPDVKSFKIGDKVMGFGGSLGIGSHAQYITFPETKRIVFIPENINYEQAAACLEGAYCAAIGINQIKPVGGQKALVYGATGAIGSAYVQYFKFYNVYVTAVCGGENWELVRSWGADKISEAFTYVATGQKIGNVIITIYDWMKYLITVLFSIARLSVFGQTKSIRFKPITYFAH